MKVNKGFYIIVVLMSFFIVPIFSETMPKQPSNYNDTDAGTETNPFQITDLANLRWLSETRKYWGSPWLNNGKEVKYYFLQTEDIDATETKMWNEGKGFEPVGLDQTSGMQLRSFFGDYDGGGFKISNLTVNNGSFAGLFGETRGSVISNVHLRHVNFTVSSQSTAGGIVCWAVATKITGCSVTGAICGSSSEKESYLGGLVGEAISTGIYNSYSSVNIKVNTVDAVGGLVGFFHYSALKNSFFNGTIVLENPNEFVGGLVGREVGYGYLIESCYVTGTSEFVNVDKLMGDMLISVDVDLKNNFWDAEATGITKLTNNYIESLTNLGLSTEKMKLASTYINAGWDFEDVWSIDPEINNGYPYLRNNVPDMGLEPPLNLEYIIENHDVILTWDAPEITSHLKGYKVYRDHELLTPIFVLGETFTDTVVPHGAYIYSVNAVYEKGESAFISVNVEVSGVNSTDETFAQHTMLKGNYPNPFNPTTTIHFGIGKSELGTHSIPVVIDVFNIKGQKIRNLVNRVYPAGEHKVVWDGRDDSGREVGSGVYFYQFNASEYRTTQKMLLIK